MDKLYFLCYYGKALQDEHFEPSVVIIRQTVINVMTIQRSHFIPPCFAKMATKEKCENSRFHRNHSKAIVTNTKYIPLTNIYMTAN
jgi:hypothetical protein